MEEEDALAVGYEVSCWLGVGELVMRGLCSSQTRLVVEQLAIREPGSQLLSSKCARLDWRLELLSSKTEQVD